MTAVFSVRRGTRAKPRTTTKAAPVEVAPEVAVLTTTMTVVSILCAWLVLQLLVLGGISQARAQTVMHDRFRTDLAAATAPVGGAIAWGTPVATVKIVALDLDQVVVEGTTSSQTVLGPGHRRDTVLPGQAGTSVVYGRASTYGAPFARLGSLQAGDTVSTITGQGRATYVVERVRRAGDPLPQPLAAGAGRLTLVGAEGTGRLSAFAPGEVIYVDAALTSRAFEPGAARAAAVSEAEQPMGRDRSVLPLLTLVLAGLAVAIAAAVVARVRLGAVRAWVLVLPPVLALTWIATDLAMGLLPNLL